MPLGWKKSNVAQPPQLSSDEEIIWSSVNKKGISHREISQYMCITNFSIILSRVNAAIAKIPLSFIDDIIIIDSHSQGQGSHMTVGTGGYYSRAYIGTSNFKSQSVGNIIMMHGGRPIMTWNNMKSPYELKNLILTEKRQQQNVTDGMMWINKPN